MNRFRSGKKTGTYPRTPKAARAVIVVEIDIVSIDEAEWWAKTLRNYLNLSTARHDPEVRAVAIEYDDGTMTAIL